MPIFCFPILVYLSNVDDRAVMQACGKLPELRESLARTHSDCRLEATLGLGCSKTREWLSRANIPIPRSLLEFQEKRGPAGKMMPSTGKHGFEVPEWQLLVPHSRGRYSCSYQKQSKRSLFRTWTTLLPIHARCVCRQNR